MTGGLGYIGSHICLQMLSNGYNVVIIDNLSNSNISKLQLLHNHNTEGCRVYFYKHDLTDYDGLYYIVSSMPKPNVIIHLAGLKAVAESIDMPTKYYENNLVSTLNVIKIMESFNITNLIFSSSATVYGSAAVPYTEKSNVGMGITNPYGRSKYLQEEMLKDIAHSHKNWNVVVLRYFNPIGHIHDDFKEDPQGIPNNLYPYLLKVHKGELECLTVFGNHYDTRDGTCSRDFVHVDDLANAHLVCANKITNDFTGLKIYNVGTGVDTTVLELIKAFEQVNNTKLSYKFGPNRSGDLIKSYSNVDLIYEELGWKAKYNINDCVRL
jgi:UDP-glucose 4-epimerase